MKILHTEWSLGWGGQEIRIIAEMEAFRARGYKMMLAARKQSRIYAEAKSRGFDTYIINFGFALNPVTLWRFGHLVRKIKPQIIHTHSSKDSWIGGIIGKITGIPVIRSRHLSSTIKPKLTNSLVYRRFPHAIIASGQHIVEHLVSDIGCLPEKIYSVPAGADETRFVPKPENYLLIRKELGIPANALIVGIVAVLRSWKGHHLLLEAVQTLIQKNLSFHILVIGNGPRRDTLKKMSHDMALSNHVHFLGHRTDVERYYPAMDIHVLPSIKNEATSQVTPQAMLCNTVNIVSNAGGLTEVIQNEKNGLVVPANNSHALAIALERLLKNTELRKKLANKGRQDSLKHFTFSQQIEKTQAVYKKTAILN